MSFPIEAVFFDLDGTLLDTAKDLVAAINHVLVYHHQKPKPFDLLRQLIGGGTDLIVSECFHLHKGEHHYNLYKQQILQAYQQRLSQETDFFPGIAETLTWLHKLKIPWGVITNKPFWLAEPLLQKLSQPFPFHCLIGRETLLTKKPNPEPLLYACHSTRVATQNSVYIGDAKSDIIAAKKALMQSVAAAYGYRHEKEQPKEWQADHVIYSGYDLIEWLLPRIDLGRSFAN